MERGTEPVDAEPVKAVRRPWFKHPLVRRLPLLLVAAIGIWLWRSEGSERTLIWQLPRDRAELVSFEVQLLDDRGTLVKREGFFFQRGAAPAEVPQKLKLKSGAYQAQAFFGFGAGRPTKAVRKNVTVDAETIWVNLAAEPMGALPAGPR